MNRSKYVLGFLFNADGRNVVLCRRSKPEWQKGLLNGIGGHIEHGETPQQAMSREGAEELGERYTNVMWQPFVKLTGDDWDMWCFRAYGDLSYLPNTTDVGDPIEVIFAAHATYYGSIPNLQWLIPLAQEKFCYVEGFRS